MPKDPSYLPVPYIYKSRGLSARPVSDQVAPYMYLNLLNCLEREENSMSSRYGTTIVNRDPAGIGTTNYFFPAPINSLARMTYAGVAYRYAGDTAGGLWRRTTDVQGAYTKIASNLSGQPFNTVVTNCFQTSQAYLFIYDLNTSLKDNGTLTAPQLTGIDPSPYTLSATPYAPLLTLIDNFATGNTYTTSGFSVAWAFSALPTLIAASGQLVTDFPEFLGVQPSGSPSYTVSPASASAVAPTTGSSDTEDAIASGFTSASVTAQDAVTLTLNLNWTAGTTGGGTGSCSVMLSYSVDSGATWTPFYSTSAAPPAAINTSFSITVPGLTNINTLQVMITVSATSTFSSIISSGTISAITVVITAPNVFGPITDGMLSVLNSNTSINVPINSVMSTTLVSGVYTQLLVMTQVAHGRSANQQIAVYGSSNDLVDGYYKIIAVPTSKTLTVAYLSSVAIGSFGGVLVGGATAPSTCVLTQEYSLPYPTQMSAWGFYQQVPTSTSSFPIGSWIGTVAQNTTATVGKTVPINLNINNEATDDDLIVLTIAVGDPASVANVRLQFDVNASSYTSSYYYKDISPSFFQQNIEQLESAYNATSQQIFADAVGLLTGQPPNSTTAQLQPANLSTGQGSWVTVYLRRGDFVPVGQAGESGSDWTAISGWQLVLTTNTVGSSTFSVNGIYFQWGYGPSSFGGVGYDYRQTYFNVNTGTESNATPTQKFDPRSGYLPSLIAPIFLRQAVQILGQYSTDSQVTHVRIYRRGGLYSQNWFMIDQIPNITAAGQFVYKDVVPDALLSQAKTLVLDNDPPVTSSLRIPIVTALSAATTSPGSTIYSIFSPQLITVTNSGAVFVPEQVVIIGDPSSLEEVRVIMGGTGKFTAIVRLQHNIGEPVNVYSIPRVACNLCALAYGQTWLAGDKYNPNYLYFSKKGLPENFGPQNYLPVGSSGDTINIVVNWRGTLFVATDKSWWIIVGGAVPYPQPTGVAHGAIAQKGWAQTEAMIWFRAADGYREFNGASGNYMTLPVEFIFRSNPVPPYTPAALIDPTQSTADVMAFYNNVIYTSYVSSTGARFRLNWDDEYKRFRNDDIAATAMLWEQDTNTFLVATTLVAGVNAGAHVIAIDQQGDYDDGGWSGGFLVKLPIALTLQSPFLDLGHPHFAKQWNVLETDVNTQSQNMSTALTFNTEPPVTLNLPNYVGNLLRNKQQFQITPPGAPIGSGQEAYSMSLTHTMNVLVAPTFYQENIYAVLLADHRNSFDTYWLKFASDQSKIVKQCYFDYTSAQPITVNLYADGSMIPYFTFTLPAEPTRLSVRQIFLAWKPRLWRMIMTSTGDFQMWSAPSVEQKSIREGSTYAINDLGSPQP